MLVTNKSPLKQKENQVNETGKFNELILKTVAKSARLAKQSHIATSFNVSGYLNLHGGGRVVSASGSETSVSSSTPTSAIIYDAYTSTSEC